MVDIGVPDTEDLASTDKSILVDIVRREIEAAGKNRQTMSDEELEKEVQAVAERVGTKISAKDFGPRVAVSRDPEQSITIEREKEFAHGEEVRGRRLSPPDAFFQNVPEAMAEAIGKVNQQIITQPQPQERTFPKPQMKPSQEVTVQDAADQVRDTAESKGLSSIGEGARLAAEQDIPPDVDAPDPDSFDPISIVIVVELGTVATIKTLSSKSPELKLELVIAVKLSNLIISN